MDFQHPYLTRQLIAYIGNKRSLLSFLAPVFSELAGRARVRRFLDPFAGSGAVARLAKYMGFEVEAADLEHYAWVLNAAALEVEAGERDECFRELGGLSEAIETFHAIGAAAADAADAAEAAAAGSHDRSYIARHYAPAETGGADYRRERLFYTAENARYIDAVRNAIEDYYPGRQLSDRERKAKLLLLSALLFEASTHANTSGVFKAYHKGFGGHGKDALSRIMAPMRLEEPPLVDGTWACRAEERDAAEFLAGRAADLVYLDPPYNSHQYGSNYFMLNTIARWDKPKVSAERDEHGRLARKAGIREDWTETRSDFCSKARAEGAFERVLDSIDARFIVLSYSTDGVVPLERLVELLSERGRVELFGTDYVQYRGGRQSISRSTKNIEFAIAVTTGERASSGGLTTPADSKRIRRFFLEREVASLLRDCYVPDRVREHFDCEENRLMLPGGIELEMPRLFRFESSQAELAAVAEEHLPVIRDRLQTARCRDRREEARVLISLLRDAHVTASERRAYHDQLLRALRKFAYRKYAGEFEGVAEEIEAACRTHPERFAGVGEGLSELRALARRRFEG
ncbi:MAG: DNA adenine methylase [Spirochaetota bacterium]